MWPAFRWGSSPVSSKTSRAQCSRYSSVVAKPSSAELDAGRGEARLRPVTEREQGLLTARPRAGASNLQDFHLRQVGRASSARRPRERAVVADVATKLRERDEHLARIAHARAEPAPSQRFGLRHQRVEVIAFGQRERLFPRRRHVRVEVRGHVDVAREPGERQHLESRPRARRGTHVRRAAALTEGRLDFRRQAQAQRIRPVPGVIGYDDDVADARRGDEALDLRGGRVRRVGRDDDRAVVRARGVDEPGPDRRVEAETRVLYHRDAVGRDRRIVRDQHDLVDRAGSSQCVEHAAEHPAEQLLATGRIERAGESRLAAAPVANRHDRAHAHARARRDRCDGASVRPNASAARASCSRSSSVCISVGTTSAGTPTVGANAASAVSSTRPSIRPA